MPQLSSPRPSKLFKRSGRALSLPNGIAILSVHTCPYAALGGKKTGGMNVYIRDLAESLGSRGIKVDVFTHCESKTEPTIKHIGQNVSVIHITSGPPITLEPIKLYPHLQEFTTNVLAYVKKANKKYQLIHANYWLSGLVGLTLRDQWHIPLLTTFHTLGLVKEKFLSSTRLPPRTSRENRSRNGILKTFKEPPQRIEAEKLIVHASDHLLGFTPDEREHLVNLYQADRSKISLIPPGVNINRFHPYPEPIAKAKLGIPPHLKLLLFVGRLDPIKGLENLLKAIKIIESHPDFCVAIIGGDEVRQSNRLAKRLDKQSVRSSVATAEKQDKYLGEIKSLARYLQIDDTTAFLGSQDQRLLPYYYSAAAMTIIPSSYESFGLVALESMACGTPVIASNVGGLKYLVRDQHTGFLVPSNNVSLLAQNIQSLLTNKTLRQKLGKQARVHAQKYSWQIITPLVLKLYHNLIENH